MKLSAQSMFFGLLACSALALPQVASAQPRVDYVERNHTLTIQPLLLVVPIGVLMYEARLTEPLGVAVFGGYGQFDYQRAGETVEATVYGIGTQIRFYAFDRHRDPRVRFGEPHLGIQALWAHGEGEEKDAGFFDTFGDHVWGRGEQFMAGPFAGYKYVAPFGLTAEVQLGAQAGPRYSYGGESNTGTVSEPVWEFKWMPIANLGVGWSF